MEEKRLINVVGELGVGEKAVMRKVADLMYDREVFELGIMIREIKESDTLDDIDAIFEEIDTKMG